MSIRQVRYCDACDNEMEYVFTESREGATVVYHGVPSGDTGLTFRVEVSKKDHEGLIDLCPRCVRHHLLLIADSETVADGRAM